VGGWAGGAGGSDCIENALAFKLVYTRGIADFIYHNRSQAFQLPADPHDWFGVAALMASWSIQNLG
jgi:hypothetical protein